MKEIDNMYKHPKGERIISLADLIEEVFRKFWVVIIFAVVFTILCAGYKYIMDQSTEENTVQTTSLTAEEMNEVNSVRMLYDQVAASEEYMSESIRMNIDPYHEERVIMEFSLASADVYPSSIMQMFETYIKEGELSEDLQAYYSDVNTSYLSELVSVVEENGTIETIAESEQDEFRGATFVFGVLVIAEDKDTAIQLAGNVEKCLNTYSGKIISQFGDFDLTMIHQSEAQVYDNSLKLEQTTALTDLITQQNRIDSQRGSFSDGQNAALDYILNGNTESEYAEIILAGKSDDNSEQASDITVSHISLRYCLAGCLIGIVVGIIVIILCYIARGTLNIAEEIPGEFGIPVLGQLHESKQKNPLVRAWRRLVYKKKPLSLETERQILLANLLAFCQKNAVNRILLTGTTSDLSGDPSLQEIQTILSKNEIETVIAEELPDRPETIELLCAVPCIVLVETLRKSYYGNIVREMELCMEQNVKVAGVIVLE